MYSSDSLNFYIQIAQVGAALISVVSAMMIVRVMDYLSRKANEKEFLSDSVDGNYNAIEHYVARTKELRIFAATALRDAQDSLAAGNTQRVITHTLNLGSSGGFDKTFINNELDVIECRRTIKNCDIYEKAIKPLGGRLTQDNVYGHIRDLRAGAAQVMSRELRPEVLTSIAAQDEKEMLINLSNNLESVSKEVKVYQKTLFSNSVISLILFTITLTFLCVFVPMLFAACTTPEIDRKLLVLFVLIGILLFMGYSAHLLVEVRRLGIFYWSQPKK